MNIVLATLPWRLGGDITDHGTAKNGAVQHRTDDDDTQHCSVDHRDDPRGVPLVDDTNSIVIAVPRGVD